MNHTRRSHGCGTFAFSGKNITVVAGGRYFSHLDSTEYLDLDEATDYLVSHDQLTEDSRRGRIAEPEWFKIMDANKDGLIQPSELDEDS